MSDHKQLQQLRRFFPFSGREKLICTLYHYPYFHLLSPQGKSFIRFDFFHITYLSQTDTLRSLKLVHTFHQDKMVKTD